MTTTTLSSREFDQDTSRTKKADSESPVFNTDHSRPADVLLGIEDCDRITSGHRKIADALAMPDLADIEFDPHRVNIGIRPADLL